MSIARNGDWGGTVRLRTHEQIGQGFCYVPAGPFRVGGDGARRGSRDTASVDDNRGFRVAVSLT